MTKEVRLPNNIEHSCWRSKTESPGWSENPIESLPPSGEATCAACGYLRGWQNRDQQCGWPSCSICQPPGR